METSGAEPAPQTGSTWSWGALPGIAGLGLLFLFFGLPDSHHLMVRWPWSAVWHLGFLLIWIGALLQLRAFRVPFQGLGYGLDWAILCLTVSLIVGGIFAPFPLLAIQNSLQFFGYIALLYVIHNSRLRWLSYPYLYQGLIFVGLVAGAISLSHWQPTPEMWLSNDFHEAIRNRFPLGHHNFSGGFFCLLLPLAIGGTSCESKILRRLNFGASLVIAIALYSTGSRGAWLGAAAMVMVAFIGGIKFTQGQQRRRVLVMGSLALLTVGLLSLSNPRVRNAFTFWQPGAIVSTTDGPTWDRIFMAKAAFNVFKDRPLAGVGVGNLNRVYNLYRPIEAGMGLELVQQLHNTPANLLAELGILGLASALFLIGCSLRLGWRLAHTVTNTADQLRIYGIGLSGWGYFVSSLTDYQLENIPISLTLVFSLSTLLGIAQQSAQQPMPSLFLGTQFLGAPARRLGSLGVLIFIGIALQFWVRSDTAFALTQQALNNQTALNLVKADRQFNLAAKITPWDPIPSALGARQFIKLIDSEHTEGDESILSEQAIEYFDRALVAAPNDTWFHNNLAVLHLATDPQKAERYASQAIQLLPRSPNYNYYTLGLTYLAQNKRPEATAALALETLESPNFIAMELWQTPTLATLKAAVLDKAITYYQTLLASLSGDEPYYKAVYEQLQLMVWWSGKVSPDLTKPQTSITQALLQAETAPQAALQILDDCPSNACQLLRAWLEPDRYLTPYLSQSDLSQTEQQTLRTHIDTHRDLKAWLQSTWQIIPMRLRYGLSLAYRNYSANQIDTILRPEPLSIAAIANTLGLFTTMPREFPELDRLMETIRTQELGLMHPTRTSFRLVPPDL